MTLNKYEILFIALFIVSPFALNASNPALDSSRMDVGLFQDRITTLIHSSLAPFASENIESIIAVNGNPRSIETEIIANKHTENVNDTVRMVNYPSQIFRIYTAAEDNRSMITHSAITGEGIELNFGVRVGMDSRELMHILGIPQDIDSNMWIYQSDEEPTSQIVFEFDGYAVTRINFAYYTD